MAHIFLSYGSDDRWIVELLSAVFAIEGYTVWYDKALTADGDYHSQIKKELDAAHVVLSIWSTTSIKKSRWIYSEADAADRAGKLICASTDGVVPPMPFDRINRFDLSGWSGSRTDPRVVTLLQSVRSMSVRESDGTNSAPDVPMNVVATRAWILIADSLTPHAYEHFLATHKEAPQSRLAQEHLRALRRWGRVNRDDPFAIHAFLQTGPYAALGMLAKTQINIAKDAYVSQRVTRIMGNIGQFEGPKSFLGTLAMLAALPLLWMTLATTLVTPFGIAAAGVRALFEARPDIRSAVEGFVQQILTFDILVRLGLDTTGWPVAAISIGLLAVPLTLSFFALLISAIGREAKRIGIAMRAQIREYHQDKVATL